MRTEDGYSRVCVDKDSALLSEVLVSLNAFEYYSTLCSHKNEEDQVLHNHIHKVTAQVRSQMEQLLKGVLNADRIELSGNEKK